MAIYIEEVEAPLRQRSEQGILAALDMPVTVIRSSCGPHRSWGG
ncbi:hypothetical protein [Paenibacillus popilliae]|nr:hypothetical protein [Paenibacillus popilliae]